MFENVFYCQHLKKFWGHCSNWYLPRVNWDFEALLRIFSPQEMWHLVGFLNRFQDLFPGLLQSKEPQPLFPAIVGQSKMTKNGMWQPCKKWITRKDPKHQNFCPSQKESTLCPNLIQRFFFSKILNLKSISLSYPICKDISCVCRNKLASLSGSPFR